MIILDSNVLSELMQPAPEPRVFAWLDSQPRELLWTTTINIFEVRVGLQSMAPGKRQILLSENFGLVLEKLEHRVAAFDLAAANRASELMAERKKRGRAIEIRDTMIAGIALAQHAALATRNTRDFEDALIPVVNPWVYSVR